jgi:hypothetical protein
MNDKYTKAISQYYKANQEIKRLTKEIGDSSYACYQSQDRMLAVDHLKDAYDGGRDDCGHFEHTNGNPVTYLAEVCPQCLHTHNLIQERKDARQKFGLAKRAVTMLGRELCKA